MADAEKKSIMRNVGEFVGHIFKAVKTDPGRKTVVKKTVEEEDQGDVVLRRTTIEEIEIKGEKRSGSPPPQRPRAES